MGKQKRCLATAFILVGKGDILTKLEAIKVRTDIKMNSIAMTPAVGTEASDGSSLNKTPRPTPSPPK